MPIKRNFTKSIFLRKKNYMLLPDNMLAFSSEIPAGSGHSLMFYPVFDGTGENDFSGQISSIIFSLLHSI